MKAFPPLPSAWVVRWAGLIPRGGRVLDLACGAGRHAVYLAGLGHRVEAVDLDLAPSGAVRATPGVAWRQADLERGGWPFAPGAYQGVVVTNYLHRPLFPHLLAALAPGGALIYETFAMAPWSVGRGAPEGGSASAWDAGDRVPGRLHPAPGSLLASQGTAPPFAVAQEACGRPRNPAHLLLPGELLEAVRGRLRVVAYEDVTEGGEAPKRVQRLCALRPAPMTAGPGLSTMPDF